MFTTNPKGVLIILAMIVSSISFAQNEAHVHREHWPCPTHHFFDKTVENHPELGKRALKAMSWIKEHSESRIQKNDQEIIIPVVIHVVYSNSYENISNAQITDQLNILNQDFNKENYIQNSLTGVASDANLRFELATEDPDGNPTNGIIRKSTYVPTFHIDFNKSYNQSPNNDMKVTASGGSDAWPNDKYLNIWVVELQSGLRGFATFPNSVADQYDGVVVNYEYFGSIGTGNDNANYDGGRTLTHEVGHWLSLKHIWGSTGCNVDDGVNDTPEQSSYTAGCPGVSYSCGSGDLWQNFMDYTYDDCLQLFTEGQKNRMRAVFDEGGPRSDFQHKLSLGLIGDKVWQDINMDGIQQNNEPGVRNIQVNLYDMNYQIVKTEMTDVNGNYLIDEIPEGEYFLEFMDNTGLSFTTSNAGSTLKDSDVNHQNGPSTTSTFTVNAGQYKSDIDAGVVMSTLAALKSSLNVMSHGDEVHFSYTWLFDDPVEQMILESRSDDDDFVDVLANLNRLDLEGSWNGAMDRPEENLYFRVKTIAQSGRVDYSNIVAVSARDKVKFDVQVFPNPVQNELQIQSKNVVELANMTIYNAMGQKIVPTIISQSIQEGHSLIKIDTSPLFDGIYYLTLEKDNTYHHKTLYVKH